MGVHGNRRKFDAPVAAGFPIRHNDEYAADVRLVRLVVQIQPVQRVGLDVADDRERNRGGGRRGFTHAVDLAERDVAQDLIAIARVRQVRRSLLGLLTKLEYGRGGTARRHDNRGDVRTSVRRRFGKVVEEADGVEIPRRGTLLASHQRRQLARNRLALWHRDVHRRVASERVELYERVAVTELIQEQHLERFQQRLVQERPLPSLGKIGGPLFNIQCDDVGQAGGRSSGWRYGQTVGKPEQAHVGLEELVIVDEGRSQSLGEAGHHQARRGQRDAHLPHPGAQQDGPFEARIVRLESRGVRLPCQGGHEVELHRLRLPGGQAVDPL